MDSHETWYPWVFRHEKNESFIEFLKFWTTSKWKLGITDAYWESCMKLGGSEKVTLSHCIFEMVDTSKTAAKFSSTIVVQYSNILEGVERTSGIPCIYFSIRTVSWIRICRNIGKIRKCKFVWQFLSTGRPRWQRSGRQVTVGVDIIGIIPRWAWCGPSGSSPGSEVATLGLPEKARIFTVSNWFAQTIVDGMRDL